MPSVCLFVGWFDNSVACAVDFLFVGGFFVFMLSLLCICMVLLHCFLFDVVFSFCVGCLLGF